jgi:hypothetical protein
MAEKTLSFQADGRLVVILHGAQSPSDFEWDKFLNWLRELGPHRERRVVIFSLGGGPDGGQRKKLTDLTKQLGEPAPAALLTSSALMQNVGKVLALFIRTMKVFPFGAEGEAFAFLGLSSDESARVGSIRALLERELGLGRPPRAS